MKTIEILLVEDNPGDVRLLEEILKGSDLDHHLTVVSDGMDAIAFVRKLEAYANAIDPDLILLDLELPRKNGLEVLQEIKADHSLQQIPILVVTGMPAILTDRPVSLADGILKKPANMSEFSEITQAIHRLGF